MDLVKLSFDSSYNIQTSVSKWVIIVVVFAAVCLLLFRKFRRSSGKRTATNLTKIAVNFKIPTFGIEGTWEPDESEREAAWEMYVELVTRISVAELRSDEGLLREALSSLYSFFDTTRKILREHGPSVAQMGEGNSLSFGYLAVTVLNIVLRPVLAKWHPILLDYENTKEGSVSPSEHERKWDKHEELREVLNGVRIVLIKYANLLAQVADVPSLIVERSDKQSMG